MTELILKNPITSTLKNSINSSSDTLCFAVPFISSFMLTLLNDENIKKIKDKRLITRFDESFINSFDVPTLKRLLDLGFRIHSDNNIHLKLYITDSDVFITSSNFTQGGFENNIELTVKINSANISECKNIFEEIWHSSGSSDLTNKTLEENLSKYEILKKRKTFEGKPANKLEKSQISLGKLNIELLINEIFKSKKDYKNIQDIAFEANKIRNGSIEKLKSGFDLEIFYVPENHPKRHKNIFYELVYGSESKIAGTGLRESQFKAVFEHQKFKDIIYFLCPELLGLTPWNLNDENELLKLCNGIFEIRIPQYTETIPIRLLSYFYPEYFLPIFKLEHLKIVCEACGLTTKAESKGDRLFIYNSFLLDKMKSIPYNNYVKSNIAYQILYAVVLYNGLEKGEKYESILSDYKQVWKRDFIENGLKILTKLEIIKR